ncbi:MAG TPA: YcxB family protein [Planctomycetota bacterium]|nr:YcxB family protein [Planctomycetota bacterium]
MQIEFDFTKEDRVAFNVYHLEHSPTHRRNRWTSLLWASAVWVVLWGVLVATNESPGRAARALWPLLMFVPVYAFIYPPLRRRHARRIIDRILDEGQNRAVLGRKRVTMTSVDLTAGDDMKSTTARWDAVERIEVTEAYAYIYISGSEAVILPRRAFPTDDEFQDWIEIARKYQAAASR